jgi:hypothetical protein
MATPTQIGQYEILGIIGRGGMGEVYRAQDTKMFRRLVAIKVISENLIGDADALRRFNVEQETVAGLQHPNIVTIYDRGEYEDRKYFVMEYLEGCDLALLIRERESRTLDQRLAIAIQIAEALDFAHRREVIHRDIKPTNVMVTRRGDLDQAKLLDFGIVHVSRSGTTATVTQPGTSLYMSPEQLRSDSITSRTDLFSLGIVLFELFVGVHPFGAASEALVTAKILHFEPLSARGQDPDLPEGLDALLASLLQKDPGLRPQDAGQIATELRRILRGSSMGPGSTDPPRFGNLDEMTGALVESIVTWARTREADGAFREALEGYRRAALIAPSAEWLERRISALEQRAASAATDPDAGPEPLPNTLPADTERERFIAPRAREAANALENGDVESARASVVEILRKYPNDSRALTILDRVLAISASRVDYRAYNEHLRRAARALDASRIDEARESCASARALWPDDPEGSELRRRIESRAPDTLRTLLAECERDLATAEAESSDFEGALRRVEEARDRLRRARSERPDSASLRGVAERADRLASSIARKLAEPRVDEKLELRRPFEVRKSRASHLARIGGGLAMAIVLIVAGWRGVAWWSRQQNERVAQVLIGEARQRVAAAGESLHGRDTKRIESALLELTSAGTKLDEALALDPSNKDAVELKGRLGPLRDGLERRQAELANEETSREGATAADLQQARKDSDSLATAKAIEAARDSLKTAKNALSSDDPAALKSGLAACATADAALAGIPWQDPRSREVTALHAQSEELKTGLSKKLEPKPAPPRENEIDTAKLGAWETEAAAHLDAAEGRLAKGSRDDVLAGLKDCDAATAPIESIREAKPDDGRVGRLRQRQTDLKSKLGDAQKRIESTPPVTLADLTERLTKISSMSAPRDESETRSRVEELRRIGADLESRRGATGSAELRSGVLSATRQQEAYGTLFEYLGAFKSLSFKRLQSVYPNAPYPIKETLADYSRWDAQVESIVVTLNGDAGTVQCRLHENIRTRTSGVLTQSVDLTLELDLRSEGWVIRDTRNLPVPGR